MAIVNKAQLGLGVEIRGKLNVGSIHGLREYGLFDYGDDEDIAGIYQIRHSAGKAIQVKMPFYSPTNPQTEAQQAWRALFATGVSNWQSLSESAKNEWRGKAKYKPLTGFNLYLRTWLLAQ